MIVALLLLLQIAPTFDLNNKINEQVDLYAENISDGNEKTLNYWGLLELYYSSCDASALIRKRISTLSASELKQYFMNSDCSDPIDSDRIQSNILEIAVEQELPGLIAYYAISYDNQAIIETYFDRVTNSEILIDDEDLAFLSALLNQTNFEISDIPPKYRSIILFEIVFNDHLEKYLANSINIDANTFFQLSDGTDSYFNRSIYDALQSFMLFHESRYHLLSEKTDKLISDHIFPFTDQRIRYSRAASFANYSIGRYDRSLKLQRNIIYPLSVFYNLDEYIDDSKFTQGVNLLSLGKFNEAKNIFEELNSKPNPNVSSAELFNNLSVCYLRLGEKNKYISYLLEAYETASSRDDHFVKLTILSNLFFYYSSIGDKKTALEYLDLAEQIAIESNDSYQIASIRAFTGVFYWQSENDAQKALKEMKVASEVFDPTTDFFDFSRTKKVISQIYIELDSLNRAEDILINLKDLSAENSNTNAYLESLIGLLELSLIKEDVEQAKNLLDEIDIYQKSNLEFETLVKYNTLNALYLLSIGKERLAYNRIKPVVTQVLERARTSIDSQTGFWIQEREYVEAFNSALKIYLALNNNLEAIQLLDDIKTINDVALYNSPILRANRLSEEDLANDRLLNQQIQELRTTYLNAQGSAEELAIKNQIDQLAAQREEIANKIRNTNRPKTFPIWKAVQSINQDQQLLHFTEVGDQLYITSITEETTNIRSIEFKSSEKALFDGVANNIALSHTNLIDLFEIYKMLELDSIIDSENSNLIIIPDNYLYRIPLDILPTQRPTSSVSYGSTEYLIEDFDIEYFGSLQEYIANSRHDYQTFETDLSVFAISDFTDFSSNYLPSLPFATQEARVIDEVLYTFDDKSIFLETEATKNNFIEKVSESKIVHIATHSEVSEQDPLFSTIFLNNDEENSSTNALYAYELFDKRLNSELIMLNSCSSGSGEYLQGSGIMGINRAMRYAGAKSLALNLWAVNDKVAFEFAGVFYEAINDGKSKSQAMKEAKLYLLESGNANPHYWGAFMLTGNQSPLTKKPANAGLLYPILLLLIGSVSFYLRRVIAI
ncbi:MAG: CHAT domain-containing protein [bacterium]|nr:CHAT domain-containing protein [bacterium]